MNKRTILIILALILVLGAFFRFFRIDSAPPGLYPDEAMNGSNALEALATGDFKIFYPENNGREGFFINIQALSIWLFGNVPWALRLVSAMFGTLAVLGAYLAARELFRPWRRDRTLYRVPYAELVGLLSAFFLATSFWHLNFSRVGFRAIMVPFVCSFALYFLLRGLRRGTISDLALGGFFTGLGFHTYIGFRFMPFVLLIPIIWYLWQWWKSRANSESRIMNQGTPSARDSASCTPCGVALYLFVAFLVFLPIALYFVGHPEDFGGRSTQVSIFAADSPVFEFAKSNVATIGMFFVRGDCNWRHNLACSPELNPILMPFFLFGLLAVFRNVFVRWRVKIKEFDPEFFFSIVLAGWFAFMMFPATLTREGLPHALRAIGMIPAVMIISAYGVVIACEAVSRFFAERAVRVPDYRMRLLRIRKEAMALIAVALLFIPVMTYRDYFNTWANKPDTYFAFATDMLHAGGYLNTVPLDVKKYVVVNVNGTEVRGIPMPSQTVMFITDSFRLEGRAEQNIRYVLPDELPSLVVPPGEKALILFLNGYDRELLQNTARQFPHLHQRAPGDFVVFESF